MSSAVERLKKRTEERAKAGLIPDYSAKVDTARRKSLPCVYVGQPAGPAGWHVCNHEDEPLGMITCQCRGCGPRCPGYTPHGLGQVPL